MGPARNAGVAACVTLAVLCVDYLLFKRKQRLKRRLPGPYPIPILGNVLNIGLDANKGLTALSAQYGGLFELVIEGRRVVVVSETDAMRHLMETQQKIFNVRWPLERIPRWLGYPMRDEGRNSTGIFFNNNVQSWKLHRRVANNVLGTNSVCTRNLHESMDRTQRLLETMKARTDEQGWAVADESTNALTLDLVSNVLLGQKLDLVDDLHLPVLETVNGFFKAWSFAQFIPPMLWPLVPRTYWELKKCTVDFTRFVHDIAMSVMEDVRNSETEADSTPLRKMLRQKLDGTGVFANERIEDIIGDARDFVAGGVDTTGSMTASMLRFLAVRPEILDKIRAEYKALPAGVEPGLESCKYTHAVVSEFLRHLPSVPTTFRGNSEPVEMGGVLIPANTCFLVHLKASNLDARHFPEPEAFRPERFLERPELRDYVLTFGSGSRSCPAKKLATHTMVGFLLGLANSDRRPFPVSADQDFDMTTTVTSRLTDQRVRIL